MKSKRIIVKGQKLKELIDRLRFLYGSYYAYECNNISVYIKEEYYNRINSYLSTTIIINYISENYLEIEIVSSGAGSGYTGITLGAESSNIYDVIDIIETVCKENNLFYE